MTEFEVHGPYKIPCEAKSHGRLIKTGCPRFWTEDKAHLADERGCYVFCIRAGKGYRPIYVGRTTKMSFKREAFGHHKIADHYVPALMDVHKGTPVIFFLVPQAHKGKLNAKNVGELETFLIQTGAAKNPDLSNAKGRKKPKWCISGVTCGGKGKPAQSSRDFRKAMGL